MFQFHSLDRFSLVVSLITPSTMAETKNMNIHTAPEWSIVQYYHYGPLYLLLLHDNNVQMLYYKRCSTKI
jgi:hypothetical protein